MVCFSGSIRAEDEKVDYKKLIVGKWEITKADEGTAPEGAIVEFTKDGKMKLTLNEMTFDGTYKIVKNTFEMTMKIGDDERKQTITITKIDKKEMATKNKEGKVVELKKK